MPLPRTIRKGLLLVRAGKQRHTLGVTFRSLILIAWCCLWGLFLFLYNLQQVAIHEYLAHWQGDHHCGGAGSEHAETS